MAFRDTFKRLFETNSVQTKAKPEVTESEAFLDNFDKLLQADLGMRPCETAVVGIVLHEQADLMRVPKMVTDILQNVSKSVTIYVFGQRQFTKNIAATLPTIEEFLKKYNTNDDFSLNFVMALYEDGLTSPTKDEVLESFPDVQVLYNG